MCVCVGGGGEVCVLIRESIRDGKSRMRASKPQFPNGLMDRTYVAARHEMRWRYHRGWFLASD